MLDIDMSGGSAIIATPISFTGSDSFTDATFTGKLKAPTFANTTARDAVYTSPVNGYKCILVGTGEQYYDGGTWNTLGVGTPTPNGSETVAGKYEEATQPENDSGTAVGGTGADLTSTPQKTGRTIQK
jgi:hypothetical protein